MKCAFIFPGQGAQYPSMGGDFVESFSIAKETFEEADDILKRSLSSIILQGPDELLTETKNSQTGIYTVSIAVLRVIQQLYPDFKPSVVAGLSLGEYSALTAGSYLGFEKGLPLVQYRGQFMNDACEKTDGTMAVILGLSAESVETLVREAAMPNDLWAANFNCPGQVVVSGTKKGVEVCSALAKEKGAKRVLPLTVHGAFHSGLMKEAETRLSDYVNQAEIYASSVELVMNVTGKKAQETNEIKYNLIKQVTSPVRWEQSILSMRDMGIDLFVEMGPGKTLAGFNKRIGVPAKTISIETINDLNKLEAILVKGE